LSDTISHVAPTLCIKVPTSETTSAMSKLRKIDDLRGRHKLAEPGLDGCADAIHRAFPRYQHLLSAVSVVQSSPLAARPWCEFATQPLE
jgi:hypothetical protein